MKTVVIRADGSNVIGSGHVMRCLALADALGSRGLVVVFVTRTHAGHLSSTIVDRGYQIYQLPLDRSSAPEAERNYQHWLGSPQEIDAAQTLKVALETSASWIVVDHYGIDACWELALRAAGLKILVIEDLDGRQHSCDLLVDPNLYEDVPQSFRLLEERGTQVLLGPRYALLHRTYREQKKQSDIRRGPVKRILVYFGGSDRTELTGKVVKCLSSLDRADVAVDVVVGQAYPQLQSLTDAIGARRNFTLHRCVPSLAPLMGQADLAIGAAGTTSWERLSLWLPALVISTAQNQIPNARALSGAGYIEWIGHLDMDDDALRAAISHQLTGNIEDNWPGMASADVDGAGADRVVNAMLGDAGLCL